jgi:hypothetical protein
MNVVQWVVLSLGLLVIATWLHGVLHLIRRIQILAEAKRPYKADVQRCAVLLGTFALLAVVILWGDSSSITTPNFSTCPKFWAYYLSVLSFFYAYFCFVVSYWTRGGKKNAWPDELVPEAPFTGHVYDRYGAHFVDEAATELLKSFQGFVILFFREYRKARDLKICQFPDLGWLTVDVTIVGTEKGRDFDEAAAPLPVEVVDFIQRALIKAEEEAGQPLNKDQIYIALGQAEQQLHEKERSVRFGLMFKLTPPVSILSVGSDPR